MRRATPTRTRRKYSFSANSRRSLDIAAVGVTAAKGFQDAEAAASSFKRLIGGVGLRGGVSEEETAGLGGQRIIVALYVVVVTIAGLMGGIIGSIGLRDLQAVSAFGLITFQPTPLGLAMFGVTTIGTLLGVLLLLVVFVSRRYADE